MGDDDGIITLLASGYIWYCPDCGEQNEEIEVESYVICEHCNAEYDDVEAVHAY